MKNQMAPSSTKGAHVEQQRQQNVVLRILDGEVDLGGAASPSQDPRSWRNRGVELILGRGLQVAVQLVPWMVRILHLLASTLSNRSE
jgi:hypothetical protein